MDRLCARIGGKNTAMYRKMIMMMMEYLQCLRLGTLGKYLFVVFVNNVDRYVPKTTSLEEHQ